MAKPVYMHEPLRRVPRARFPAGAARFAVVAFAGCASADRSPAAPANIGYLHLSLVVDYLAKGDDEAREMAARKRALRETIDASDKKLSGEPDIRRREQLVATMGAARGELEQLANREKTVRGRYYAEIQRAVERVAGRRRIDFVLNMGEGLVYSRREFDVTEDVLREIQSTRRRSAPLSR